MYGTQTVVDIYGIVLQTKLGISTPDAVVQMQHVYLIVSKFGYGCMAYDCTSWLCKHHTHPFLEVAKLAMCAVM